jgi:aspartyl-tRNA(Asn)/glutamyl-tRNA(Gln) amidotransferase subunit A
MKLHDLSATALLEGYASKKFSPVDVIRDVISRVQAFEPHIRATYLFAPEKALADAEASSARWARGEPSGPLDGVPATIKENIATKGDPKPLGTAATDLTPSPADAPPAARLREAGAILFSKTTMPDYGMLSSGLSSFHPLTRNPWDYSKGPGGSSSGAGAAGAAGYGPLHLGTDIGGSVRLPAGWCGLVGLKPSAGRVPIDPPYVGRAAGPLTRTVDDAALMMATLSQPDARDYTSLPPQTLDWRLAPLDLKGVRIAVIENIGVGAPIGEGARTALARAAKDFERAGAIVEPVGPLFTQAMLDGLDLFWRTRSLIDIDALAPEKRALVLPFIREWRAS